MSISRRDFLATSASLATMAVAARAGVTQSTTQSAANSDQQTWLPPSTAAGKVLCDEVGNSNFSELHRRLMTVNSDIRTHGLKTIRNVPGTFLTGYPYNEFYDWDLYFENLYLSYYGVWPYCFSNVKEFLNRQKPDGYVNRSLIKQRDRQHFKPFLAQLVVLGCRQNKNDYEWVRGNYYDRLKKYLDKWFSYDGDKNGLPTWNSADAAGTDNQWSRAGQLAAFEIEGVDLASYLIRELRAMAVIAGRFNLAQDVKSFNDHADQLTQLINDTFWDEQDGMYYDRNEKTGKAVKVKSATCFMPLFAGAATPERAKRIVNQHLLNPDEFWLNYPVASYARTEPDYYQGSHKECNWRGPTWAPTNYMIFQGVRRYGFNDVAKDVSARLFEMAVVKNPVLREYYNAESGEGLGQTRFWGFTALYYVLPLEFQLGYDSSDLEKEVRPIISDELGIQFDPPAKQ